MPRTWKATEVNGAAVLRRRIEAEDEFPVIEGEILGVLIDDKCSAVIDGLLYIDDYEILLNNNNE